MRKYFLLFLYLFVIGIAYTQTPNNPIEPFADQSIEDNTNIILSQNSWDGAAVYPVGQFRALNILINIIYDVTPSLDPFPSLNDPWPSTINEGINTTIPNWVSDSSLFDIHFNPPQAINGTFTRKFHEASFGALHIIGDFVIINIPQSYIVAGNPEPLPDGQFEFLTLLDQSIEYLNTHSNGGLQTYFGSNSIHDYEFNNNDTIYFASIATRNTFHTLTTTYGFYNANNGTAGPLNRSILFSDGNYYPIRFSLLQCVGSGRHLVENPVAAIYHEFGHALFGYNKMHSGGGNGWSGNTGRTFLPRMGGYGLMGMASSGMVSANGFDRWWLHWKSPVYNTSNSYIAASNQPSDITQADGTKNFTLRDFVTTGDAIRIKLPYVDNGAKNQYIWLENHKIGTNNKLDFLTYSNTTQCRPGGRSGIYAFYQVGKDVLSGENIRPSGESDHLRLISAEGNFNYMKMGDVVLNCFANTTKNGHGRQLDPNPFMGCNDAMIQFYHASANTLKIDDPYIFLLDAKDMFINGQWVRNDSMPFLMDERDAFTGTRMFNLSSNPAPVNTTTFYNTNDQDGIISANTLFGLVNNDSIYLSGLNIIMNPLANGDYKVTIDWGHNRLDNSVAWTGKIALPESLYIYDDDTLLLKQNNTPCLINRNPNTHQFAPFTVFDCRENSQLTLSNTSRMIASEGSKIYVQPGSVLILQNSSKLIVKTGCELIIEDCGNLVIRDNAQLVIEPGGIITIKSGANVFMDGQDNLVLQLGFLIGPDGNPLTGNILDILGVPPVKQITSNTNWAGKTYKFFDDLYISSGATLDLSGTTLQFFRSAKVKVGRGAKLNMTNQSKLTTSCIDEFWAGIEIWGNPSLPQTPTTNQGHVVMNSSTIEFAKTGVLLDRPMPTDGSGTPSVKGNGGGILQATSSSFINNYIGVNFSPYVNDNVSSFSNCLFTANEQYPDLDEGIECHINLNSVIGIDFLKCTFNTVTPFGGRIKSNYGIRSHNSNFLVDGIISNHKYQRSVFENLNFGIYATSSLSSRNFTVRNTVFRLCNTGVFGSGISGSIITENRFIQPTFKDQSKYTQFGIFLEYCNRYKIQQDTILGIVSHTKSEVGMLIKNSGPNENLVYNNVMLNSYVGIIAEGENRGVFGTGLCIKCNDFGQNMTDIYVIPSAGIPDLSQGIKRNQGSNQDTITAPAGNWFTYPSNKDIININNVFAQPIEYFYHRFPLDPRIQPQSDHVIIFDNTVFLTRGTSQQYYKNTACPSDLNTKPRKEELIALINTTNSELTETQSLLTALTDDGDTPVLINNITSAAPFEALWLHDELLGASPYLSDTALIEASKKEEVLNSALVRDVLVANPHSAKSYKVIEALEQREEPLPEELMEEIKAGKEQISAKQELELTKADLLAELAASRSALLQSFQEENNYDSLRWVLSSFPEPLSEYQKIWTWFDEGDTGYGITALQNLDIETLPAHHRDIQIRYLEIAGILNQLATDTTYVLSDDTVTINALFSLSNEDNAAGVSARNLLFAYRLLSYEPTVTLPDTSLKTSTITNKPKTNGNISREKIQVFPNPANDFIVVAYNMANDSKLSIVSQEGRVVYTQSISAGQNELMVRVNHFASGNYIVSMTEGKMVHSKKFTVK